MGSFTQDFIMHMCLGMYACLSGALELLPTCPTLRSVQLEDVSSLFPDVFSSNHPAGGVQFRVLQLLSREQQVALTKDLCGGLRLQAPTFWWSSQLMRSASSQRLGLYSWMLEPAVWTFQPLSVLPPTSQDCFPGLCHTPEL